MVVGPRARHTPHRATMSNNPRQLVLSDNICNLLYSLKSSTYSEIAPKIGYWIEFVLTEPFMTTDYLVEQISPVAWERRSSDSHIPQFLKEFYDAPHRSERMKLFVDELCLYVLRWFAVASTDDLWKGWDTSPVSKCGGRGFLRAAWFVGHLIEYGLLSRELVRRYLFKPLTSNHYEGVNFVKQSVGANAIYILFTVAGSTLLRGFLEPEDVQACFERLETRITFGHINGVDEWDAEKLKVRCDSHFHALHHNLTCGLGASHDPRYLVGEQRGGRPRGYECH